MLSPRAWHPFTGMKTREAKLSCFYVYIHRRTKSNVEAKEIQVIQERGEPSWSYHLLPVVVVQILQVTSVLVPMVIWVQQWKFTGRINISNPWTVSFRCLVSPPVWSYGDFCEPFFCTSTPRKMGLVLFSVRRKAVNYDYSDWFTNVTVVERN